MNIQDRLKAGSVKRWNIVETTRQQTLAEHMFNVAMIAGEIAKLIATVPVSTVYSYAIQHDLEEVILGDIPTPTKAKMKEYGLDYNSMAESVFTMPEADKSVRQVVKMADTMEALWFIRNHKIGRHAEKVHTNLSTKFNDMLHGKIHITLRNACLIVWAQIEKGEIEI